METTRQPGRLRSSLTRSLPLTVLTAITLAGFSLTLNAQTPIGADRNTDPQQTPRAISADITPKISEYMDALIKAGWFNGSILIAQNGKVLVSKGYGLANVELDVPNTPQTKFRVGSITKVFTAISIMLLQERGKLSLQDSICKYMADCPASWQPITIHQLLSHTSGLAKHDTAGVYLKTAMLPMTLPQLHVSRIRPRVLRSSARYASGIRQGRCRTGDRNGPED